MTGIERYPKFEAILAAAISLIAPMALYVINPAWAYAMPGWVDNYSPVAVALSYTDPTFWADYYKISRMPWNMAELVYRNLFSVDAQHIALHFSVFSAMGLLAFIVGKRLFGRFGGLFLAVVVNALPLMISSDWNAGLDYQNSFPAMMLLGFIAAVSYYRAGYERLPAFVAGIALMNAVLSNSTYLQMAPLVLAITIAVLVRRRATLKSAGTVFAFGLIGAACTVVFWGLINLTFGRPFAFFIPEYHLISGMLSNPKKDIWWEPITSEYLARFQHFGFLIAAAIIAACDTLMIAFRSRSRLSLVSLAFHIGYLCEALIWTYWQVYGHHTALLPIYFAVPLYVPALLSMTAALFRTRAEDSIIERSIFAVLAPVVFILSNAHSIYIINGWSIMSQNATAIMIFGILIAYAALRLVPAPSSKSFAVIASLAIPIALAPSARPNQFMPTSCRIYPQFNDFIIRAAIYAATQVQHIEKIAVWAPENEPVKLPASCWMTFPFTTARVAISFAAFGPKMLTDDSGKFASPADLTDKQIVETTQYFEEIAVFGASPQDVAALAERFDAAGIKLTQVSQFAPRAGQPLPTITFFTMQSR